MEDFMFASDHQVSYLRFNRVNFIMSNALRKQSVYGGAELLQGILG